jgi:excisionase family DNA binding protein
MTKARPRDAVQENTQSANNPFLGWTTIEEASAQLGRSKQTVHGWARSGKIRCYVVGRKMRLVNLAEVREFAEKHPRVRQKPVDKIAKKE